MKKSRFTEVQIVKILKEYDAGKQSKDLCLENDISGTTFHKRKQKYGGMDAQQLRELKTLQDENARLKDLNLI